MSHSVDMTRPRHRRARSLDSTDSLERLDARQQYRQQFLAIRAKFSHNQALPSMPKPRAVISLPPVPHNREDYADILGFSNTKLLFLPSTDQTDACRSLSYTSETSPSVPAGDKSDAKTIPLAHQESRSITPLSEIIQRFTSEIMNSEISSVELESQSSVKESLDSEPSDVHTSCESTAYSLVQLPVVSSKFHENTTNHDTVKPVLCAKPIQTPNLVKPTETLDQHSDTQSDSVTLRRPSDFWEPPNSAESLLQMSPTYRTNSEAFETDAETPITKQVHITSTAVPFKPLDWVKLPVTNVDQIDAAPPQIPSMPGSTVEMAESSPHPSFVTKPLLTRASSFHSSPMTEGSLSHETAISSLLHLSQEQRLSNLSRNQNLLSERLAREAIQPTDAPNIMEMTGSSTQPSFVAQPCLNRASSFHSTPVTVRSTSYGTSISSLPYLRNQTQRLNNLRRDQNVSSERFARQAIQPQKASNMPLSPQEQTDSHFQGKVQFIQRSGNTTSWTAFLRRSQMPSVPVKELVKKFSANN